MRPLLLKELRRERYDVVGCGNTVDMLCNLRHYFVPSAVGQDFDLIIADTRLRGFVPTFILLEELQQRERCPPIILMTALIDEYVDERAVRLGVVALIHKPFEVGALLNHVQEAVGGVCQN